jgi:hypothetical protein
LPQLRVERAVSQVSKAFRGGEQPKRFGLCELVDSKDSYAPAGRRFLTCVIGPQACQSVTKLDGGE